MLLRSVLLIHTNITTEMVEPLEETRSELIFATEPILSSLQLSIPGSSRYSPLVELDEIEVCPFNIYEFSLENNTLYRSKKGFFNYARALNFCIHQLELYTLILTRRV